MEANEPAEYALIVVGLIAIVGLMAWSLWWVFNDARDRGKDGCLIAMIIGVFSWPLGLLFWLLFRPDKKQ